MKALLPVGALALVLAVGTAPMARAQDEQAAEFRATTLSLSAEGEVRTAPDLAVIGLGVRTEGATAAEALARNATRMTATVAALKAQGVAPADIQTSNLSLDPQYFDDGKAPRRLTGYQASNTVSVRLRDMGRVGPVVDALVAAGANQIDSIGFQLAEPHAAEDAARREALKALQAKADLYAQATGYRIQRLVRLSEGGGGYQPRIMAAPMAFAARKVATPVEAGELTVGVSVSGLYELSR
ncbi:SIMPL domain-containing protein [Caulobacter sp. S45]|uniref:SIMPL domain-containing protein n=1 Tax=Caulobacter sp. S45 TaxID=1641861 RepID=UPI00131CE604|nr:SIMPL domain-containing protein [Caulobacter sp. S45]